MMLRRVAELNTIKDGDVLRRRSESGSKLRTPMGESRGKRERERFCLVVKCWFLYCSCFAEPLCFYSYVFIFFSFSLEVSYFIWLYFFLLFIFFLIMKTRELKLNSL